MDTFPLRFGHYYNYVTLIIPNAGSGRMVGYSYWLINSAIHQLISLGVAGAV